MNGYKKKKRNEIGEKCKKHRTSVKKLINAMETMFR